MPLIGYIIWFYLFGYLITRSSGMNSSSLVPRVVFRFVEDHVECPWPWWCVWPCCFVFLWAISRQVPLASTSVAYLIIMCTILGIVTSPSTLVTSHFFVALPTMLLLAFITPSRFTFLSSSKLWEFDLLVGPWRSFKLPLFSCLISF